MADKMTFCWLIRTLISKCRRCNSKLKYQSIKIFKLYFSARPTRSSNGRRKFQKNGSQVVSVGWKKSRPQVWPKLRKSIFRKYAPPRRQSCKKTSLRRRQRCRRHLSRSGRNSNPVLRVTSSTIFHRFLIESSTKNIWWSSVQTSNLSKKVRQSKMIEWSNGKRNCPSQKKSLWHTCLGGTGSSKFPAENLAKFLCPSKATSRTKNWSIVSWKDLGWTLKSRKETSLTW